MVVHLSFGCFADNTQPMQVLGLVWALMLRFLKFSDDEDEKISPKDALLKWLQHTTAGYANVEVKNFTSSFHDGLALCALIHKHRPDLVNFEALTPADARGNLALALDAAHQFFQLDKFLGPSDIPKLDEKCMLVFVGEFYSGIAEQNKLARASRRIEKLVKFTLTNDEMRRKYDLDAGDLVSRIAKAETLLNDKTIDNTMAGARLRLRQFNEYKVGLKQQIHAAHFQLEALHSSIATRLADNGRPLFTPSKPEFSITTLVRRIDNLEKLEQIETSLHAEIGRQLRLIQLNEQHIMRTSALLQWISTHQQAIASCTDASSSGDARVQLKYAQSVKTVRASVCACVCACLYAYKSVCMCKNTGFNKYIPLV